MKTTNFLKKMSGDALVNRWERLNHLGATAKTTEEWLRLKAKAQAVRDELESRALAYEVTEL